PGFQRLIKANECIAEELSKQGLQGYKQGKRLMACSHGIEPGTMISHCNLPPCVLCDNYDHETQNAALKKRLRNLQISNPSAKLLWGTFTARDTPTTEIRDIAKSLSRSWNSVVSSVPDLIG